jgi:hypothetical protein
MRRVEDSTASNFDDSSEVELESSAVATVASSVAKLRAATSAEATIVMNRGAIDFTYISVLMWVVPENSINPFSIPALCIYQLFAPKF